MGSCCIVRFGQRVYKPLKHANVGPGPQIAAGRASKDGTFRGTSFTSFKVLHRCHFRSHVALSVEGPGSKVQDLVVLDLSDQNKNTKPTFTVCEKLFLRIVWRAQNKTLLRNYLI